MARTRLSWLALILLVGCADQARLEGTTSQTEDDAYWAAQLAECKRLVDEIAQKKCVDKVAADQKRGKRWK